MSKPKSLSEKIDDARNCLSELKEKKLGWENGEYHFWEDYVSEKEIRDAQKRLDTLNQEQRDEWTRKQHKKEKELIQAEKQELQDKLDDRTAQREHELLKQSRAQEHSEKISQKKAKIAKTDAKELAAFKASLSSPSASALKAQEEVDIARINAEVAGDLKKSQKKFEADMYKMKAELISSKELRELDHVNLKDLKTHESSLEADLYAFKSGVDTNASNQTTTHQTNERLREAEGLMGFKQQDREHELSVDLRKEFFRHVLGKDRDTHQFNLKKPSSTDDEEVMKSLSRLLDDPEKYQL